MSCFDISLANRVILTVGIFVACFILLFSSSYYCRESYCCSLEGMLLLLFQEILLLEGIHRLNLLGEVDRFHNYIVRPGLGTWHLVAIGFCQIPYSNRQPSRTLRHSCCPQERVYAAVNTLSDS